MQTILRVQNDIQHKQVVLNNRMCVNFEKSGLRGELREQEAMSRHTSWKTGGNADYYYRAADVDDLSEFISRVPSDMPITWVGFGSNLLVRDGGIKGVVISVVGVLDKLELNDEKGITVGAGISCAKAARFAAKHGLAGVEFLAGIPGTIGGALAMNAGAYGGEIWNYVSQVETINRAGKRQIHAKDHFDIAYRSVSISDDEWFVATSLKLENSTKATVEKSIREMLAERAEAQPLGQRSCGSVFRNPQDDYAARLIDDCGLKGKQFGGATVSEKHANFIINSGNASSLDIEQLIELIQTTVYEKHAIQLIPEVKIIGEVKGNEKVVKQ
jgi:UDP-N-acetylmuramate dehydrogenase